MNANNLADIEGHHPLDPILPATFTTDTDDMPKRKKRILTIQMFLHEDGGKDYAEIVSAELDLLDLSVGKASAHLAARAAEAIEKRIPKTVKPGQD